VATKEDIITIAKNYLRDFPRFFQYTTPVSGRTYDLGRPNVDKSTLWVAYQPQSGGGSVTVLAEPSNYSVDERNGILRLVSPSLGNDLLIEGYHYEWLLPADFDFYADVAINMHTHSMDIPLASVAPAVADVIGISALINALWGLVSEYSRDIDVITSESVHITASQRYRMVINLLNEWEEEYHKRATALNIGLERMEALTLRRVSRTTNRLVPIYKPRELGDFGPPERIFTEIGDGVVNIEEKGNDLVQETYLDVEPPPSTTSTEWYT
jgi:hypothetical protein